MTYKEALQKWNTLSDKDKVRAINLTDNLIIRTLQDWPDALKAAKDIYYTSEPLETEAKLFEARINYLEACYTRNKK